MKKRLILILTVVVLCMALVGSAIAMALSAAKSGNTPSPTDDIPVGGTQIPTEDLAVSTTLPNHIFYQDTLNAHSGSWPWQCSSVVVDDYVLINVNGQDPYYTVTTGIEYKAGNYAAIYYSTSNAKNCSVQFYMGIGSPAESNMRKASLTVDGQWHQAIIDISSIVSSNKTANFLRFDPLHADSGTIPSGATIALKYIAFFDTEADAKAFDYDAYLRYLNGEPLEEVNWPNPTYQEKTGVTSADTSAGSLTYTPSADGSKVTISYKTGTKTHSYTVPNDNNYLFGGFSGTDDLDRTLHDSSEVGIVGSNGEKYVGLFYFLWHGDPSVQNGENPNALYDLQKILDANGTTKAGKVSSGLYGQEGQVHWFAEPLYGYYHNDPWVMRKHAELLCNANVDFLYFDVTNGFDYMAKAVRMMSILHELNEQGYDAPQVVFYTNSQSNTVVTNLYENIYSKNILPDTWFCINGKPVIVCTERNDILRKSGTIDASIKNFFTVKESQWPNEKKQTNGWPWIDFKWPQEVYTNASGGDRTMNISIAQHNYNTVFSSSSLYGNYKNRGRSYGSTAAQIASWSTSLGSQYGAAYEANKSMTNYGYNFQAQWDHAIKSNIQFALVTGWNEWIAQRQNGSTFLGNSDKVAFVDAASMEFSRDAEMMRGGYFDNYYMQLIYNIERFKGDAPVIMQDSRKPINVTGEFNQWDSVLVNYTDPKGDTVNRNGKGYGDATYINESGRNDIVSSKITHDTKNIYFYAQTNATISMYDTNSSWMQIYLDTDRNANTGWYGYDYIVNYKASGHFTTSVAKYTGSNNSFSFTNVGTVPYRVSGNQMMIEVPMSMLGISAYDDINMEFKWADSDTTYTTMEQFYTDGDAAPLGRLNYVYQSYIPGEKVAHTCSFGAWTTTTPATCTAEGTQTRTCTGCGKAETQSIAKTAHTEVTVSGTAATCVAEGKTEGKKCSVCQTVIVAQQSIPAKGHTEVSIPVTPATCTETGLTAGSSCSVCGEILMAQTVIPATGHTVITLGAQEATCTTPGLTEGKKCVICQTVTVAQQTIPAKGHTNNNGDLSCDTCGAPMDCAHSNLNDPVKEKEVAATCTTAGSYDLVVYCSTCHIEMSRETVSVDAKGHTEVTVSGTAATCTAEGKTDGKKCSVCQTVTVAQQTISALGHTDTNGDEVCDRCSTSLSTACHHSYVATTTDATCTTAGKTVETCSKCGDTKTTTIPAKGHTEIAVSGTAATCTAAGKTEGKKCSVCQTVTVPQQTVPALGHADTNGDKVCDRCGTSLSTTCTHNYVTTTTEATCTESGKIVERCSKCGDTKTTTIPAKGHTEVTVNGTAATCTESGLTDGKKCSVCDEIISAQETIPATGHTEITVSAKAPTCTKEGLTEGKKCSVCQTVTVPQNTIPAKGHSEQVTPAVGATCITNGKTEGVYCEICGETLVAQVAIPATGHVETTVSGTHATCTESGLTDGSKCAVCGDILIVQTTIPAAGHVEETVKGTAPTCTETGLTDGKKCSVCDTILTQQTTIPAQGHSEQILEGKDPTCTATGLTSGKQCTTCGVVLEQQTSIDATGHTAGEWIVDTEPTVESAGQRIKKCTVCDEIVAIEPIAALPAPDTEPVTTEPVTTEPVTKPVTTAPVTSENAGSDTGDNDVTSAPVSTDVADEGCGSTVSVSAFVLLGSILALAGTCLLRIKKHGEV